MEFQNKWDTHMIKNEFVIIVLTVTLLRLRKWWSLLELWPFTPLISPRLLTFLHIFLAPRENVGEQQTWYQAAHFHSPVCTQVRLISRWYSLWMTVGYKNTSLIYIMCWQNSVRSHASGWTAACTSPANCMWEGLCSRAEAGKAPGTIKRYHMQVSQTLGYT